DWSTNCAAKLVVMRGGHNRTGGCEIGFGRQGAGALVVLRDAAVILVRAALGGDVDCAARGVAGGSIGREFIDTDGVDGIKLRAEPCKAAAVLHVGDAVEQEFVGAGVAAAKGEVIRSAVVERTGLRLGVLALGDGTV